MSGTFDRTRGQNDTGALDEDYHDPRKEQDLMHYFEWFTKVLSVSIEHVFETAIEKHSERHNIHYHTWTLESFGKMIEWLQKGTTPWSEVWHHKALQDGYEFYYVLRK